MQEEKTDDEEWSGCCSHTNKDFIKYLTQIGFGASVVIFSMIQIGRNDIANKEVYFGLLSGAIGTFMPHPSLKSSVK
jgi:hypothetical protein